ncbi:MAG TPA: hypothetical protein VE650_04050 [Acetobacteraceae bacterium]|jgi:hypothetical protein|nr:hypothetical protein [Acetobacteraceae bacterium]
MAHEPRITDHDPIIAAAREDASRAGARFVSMTIGEFWRLLHGAPTLHEPERDAIVAAYLARK